MKSQEISEDKGFTLIELLIVIAFIVLFAVTVFPSYSSLYTAGQVDESIDEVIQSLRLARARSISRINNNWHGVYFSINPNGADSYIIFQGSNATASYSNRISSLDLIYTLPASIAVATTLPGAEVVFARGTGAPSLVSSHTVTLTHSSGSARSLQINTAGLAERQ